MFSFVVIFLVFVSVWIIGEAIIANGTERIPDLIDLRIRKVCGKLPTQTRAITVALCYFLLAAGIIGVAVASTHWFVALWR
jgi:hypothetical protein